MQPADDPVVDFKRAGYGVPSKVRLRCPSPIARRSVIAAPKRFPQGGDAPLRGPYFTTMRQREILGKLRDGASGVEVWRWARALALLAALVHFLLVLFVVISRINYRYDLEWLEGASLHQVYRAYMGQSLYVQPSLEYIALPYTPLYFYLAALFVNITGLSFLPLRLISFLSAVGCMLIIYRAVESSTSSEPAAFAAAGAFAATFMLGGAWFDIARVDMLFVFLCLAGVFALGRQTTSTSMLAGFLFACALMTKQTTLPFLALIGGATLLLFRRQSIPLVGSFALLALLAYWYLAASTGGWFQYYTVRLAGIHDVAWSLTPSVVSGAFGVVTVWVLVGLAPLILGFRLVLADRLHLYYYIAVAGLIGASIFGRLIVGAYNNALVPAYAGLSLLFGLGLGWLTSPGHIRIARPGTYRLALWLTVLLQFAVLAYDPTPQIPTRADRKAGDALVARLQSGPGDVLVPFHNYLGLFAGKKVWLHLTMLNEIRGFYSGSGGQPGLREVREQLRSTPFGMIMLDQPYDLMDRKQCARTEVIEYESIRSFYPVAGDIYRPTILYIDCAGNGSP